MGQRQLKLHRDQYKRNLKKEGEGVKVGKNMAFIDFQALKVRN